MHTMKMFVLDHCRAIAIILLALSCAAPAQEKDKQMNVLANVPEKAEMAKETPAVSPVEQRLAHTVLDSAQTEMLALEPLPRSYVCYEASRGVIRYDREAARKLLMQCFAASQAIEEKADRDQLQGWIVAQLLDFGPQTAEELMPQVDGRARELVRKKLIQYYTKDKKFDEAIALINSVRPEEEHFPYDVTADLIQALPEERSGDAVSLFAQAMSDYRKRPVDKNRFSIDDMGTFVARFASRMPRSMALEAIDEVLRRAKAADEDQQKLNISISNDDKTASFSSNYEYRLFQVLPILRELDPDRAEELVKQNRQLQSLMTEYPQGMGSIDPRMDPKSDESQKKQNHTQYMVNMGNGGGGPSVAEMGQQRALLNRQIAELVKKAEDNPKQSIAQALTLPGGEEEARAQALEGIARALVKKDPQVAKNAVDELVKACDGLQSIQQERYLTSAVRLLLQMDEKDAARKVIEHGFDLAAKLYQRDNSASDPNKAAKVFWPASSMWRSFLQLATKISPEFALEEIKEINNPEIQVYEKVTLANAWLGIQGGLSMVREQRKGENSFMINSGNRD